MKQRLIPAALVGAAAVGTTRRFQKDMAGARARVASVPHAAVDTSTGTLEYADVGEGEPLLVIHGIFGGRDQGLESFDALLSNRRVLAPSRFGYLGSSMPAAATPVLQAETFAEMLDSLDIDRLDVIGYSAGSASALQLALRHPTRVRALIIMCGDWPGPTATAPPSALKTAFRSDAIMWLATMVAGAALLRFVAGVPRTFDLSDADRVKARRMVEIMFPVHERSDGILFDAYIGNADVNDYPLERIEVPTLIVHAQDDTMASYASAALAAKRIPGARLLAHPRGGHLMLGQESATREAVVDFLSSAPPRCSSSRLPA